MRFQSPARIIIELLILSARYSGMTLLVRIYFVIMAPWIVSRCRNKDEIEACKPREYPQYRFGVISHII